MLGLSQARLSVRKRGFGMKEQGELCFHLGPSIAPFIHNIFEDGYEMEMLEHPLFRNDASNILFIHSQLLRIWKMNPYTTGNSGWLSRLIAQSSSYPWATYWIGKLYPEEPVHGYTLIHGDPTVSNLMIRPESNSLIMIDPMPRLDSRKEIPNLPEVDLGRLMLSTIGWEVIQGTDGLENYEVEFMNFIERNHDLVILQKTILWCSITLARIQFNAMRRNRDEIAKWARNRSQDVINILKEF